MSAHGLKGKRIKEELEQEIVSGAMGPSGTAFMTTRELAVAKDVSLKTAHRIVGMLRDSGFLELSGKRHHIRYSVRRNEKTLIGLLVTCLENPFFSSLSRNIEDAARAMNTELIIAASNYSAEGEREKLDMFCRRGVSGILACPWSVDENESAYLNLSVPYVLIGRRLKNKKADSVLVNDQMAAQKVAAHFIECGLRDFAYVGPSGLSRDERLLGFRNGLANEGMELRQENILYLENMSSRRDLESIAKLLNNRKKRLAVFCFHDLLAVRMLNACNKLGIKVPDDAAIAGFDNLPTASEVYPALTSISYPIKDMARIAFETLESKIASKETSTGIARYLEPELIVRESTMAGGKNGSAVFAQDYAMFYAS